MKLKQYITLGVGVVVGFALSVVGVSYASQNISNSVNLITSEQAKSIMLNKVPGASILEFSYEKDKKIPKYDATLMKDNYEYEVDVNAKTGQIINFEKEVAFVSNNNVNSNNTTTNNQQNTSVNNSTNTNNKNTSTNVNNSTDTNKNTSTKVNSSTSINKNTNTNVNSSTTTNKNTTTTSKTYIGQANAKSIMLGKVPGATIMKFEFDNDKTPEYEAELAKGDYEYDISVNAYTGKIKEFSKERVEKYDNDYDDRYGDYDDDYDYDDRYDD